MTFVEFERAFAARRRVRFHSGQTVYTIASYHDFGDMRLVSLNPVGGGNFRNVWDDDFHRLVLVRD